jgi:hypothetical protein
VLASSHAWFGLNRTGSRVNAVAALSTDLSGPLREQLAAIEDGLAEIPFDHRVENSRSAGQ